MLVRLQKWIAQTGACSRRQAEERIWEGRVTVNGAPAVLGQSVDPERDHVLLDGRPLASSEEEKVYIMLNKPRGYVCTAADEKGRRTVLELVKGIPQRLYPVGRLDMYSEGLLLLTNDGEITKALTHPGHDIEKEYQVRVTGELDFALPILRGPMILDGKPLKPCRIRVLNKAEDSSLLQFALTEGRNRQIRRMCEAAGLRVVRLRRVSEGGLRLGDLREGEWRPLTAQEIGSLRQRAGLQIETDTHANT